VTRLLNLLQQICLQGPLGGSVSPLAFGTARGFETQEALFSPLIFFLWNGSMFCDLANRNSIIVELGNLATLEMSSAKESERELSRFIRDPWSEVPRDCLLSFLEEQLFGGSSMSAHVASSLSAVFASLFSSSKNEKFNFGSTIFDLRLQLARRSEPKSSIPSHVLYLLFLYGTHCDQLGHITSWLLNDRTNLGKIEMFFSFLKDLHRCVESSSIQDLLQRETVPTRQTSCSYALQEGM
jgi:hypothetical protein